jgi:hypothetical protein
MDDSEPAVQHDRVTGMSGQFEVTLEMIGAGVPIYLGFGPQEEDQEALESEILYT